MCQLQHTCTSLVNKIKELYSMCMEVTFLGSEFVRSISLLDLCPSSVMLKVDMSSPDSVLELKKNVADILCSIDGVPDCIEQTNIKINQAAAMLWLLSSDVGKPCPLGTEDISNSSCQYYDVYWITGFHSTPSHVSSRYKKHFDVWHSTVSW